MSDKFKQRARALAAKTSMTYQAAVNQLRSQAGLPENAGFTTASRLFFRPFDGEAHGTNDTKLPVRGEIRGRKFLIHARGQQVEIEAEVLRDKKGLVAVLKASEHPLSDGFFLAIDFESDEPIGEGFEPSVNGMISIRREGAYREGLRQVVEERVGPVNLIAGYGSNFSLYFEADGSLEEWQRSGRAGTPPGPKLSPVQTLRLDNQGHVVPSDSSQPEFEFVNVRDFDPKDFDKTWVPDAAYCDPAMRRSAHWPKDEEVLRAPSLNQYIAAREKQTGWKLMEVQPGPVVNLSALVPPPPSGMPPVPDVVLNVILVWARQDLTEGRAR